MGEAISGPSLRGKLILVVSVDRRAGVATTGLWPDGAACAVGAETAVHQHPLLFAPAKTTAQPPFRCAPTRQLLASGREKGMPLKGAGGGHAQSLSYCTERGHGGQSSSGRQPLGAGLATGKLGPWTDRAACQPTFRHERRGTSVPVIVLGGSLTPREPCILLSRGWYLEAGH